MSLHKKHNRWYAVFYRNGKHVWKSTKQTDKKKARAIHDRWEAENLSDSDRFFNQVMGITVKPALLLADAWDLYRDLKTPSHNTVKLWRQFCAHFGETTDIHKISKAAAVKYLASGKVSAKTFNNRKSALSSIFRTLAIYDVENIWLQIPNKSVDSKPYRPFTDAEVNAILKHSDGFWRSAVVIGYCTGLRLKDIVHLHSDQIRDGFIEVMPSKTKRFKRSVLIPIHDEVKKILTDREGLLFPEAARQYGYGCFQRAFPEILKKAKVRDSARGKASFHSLRSTFITNCEKAGIDRRIIQGIVGHRSPAMTEHYSDDMESSKAILSLSVP